MYQVKNGLSPKIIKEVFLFQENEKYNLWSDTHLASRNVHTAHCRTDTITNLGVKSWKLVPDKVKNAST